MQTFYFTETHVPFLNQSVGNFVSRICFGHPDGFEKFSTMGVFDKGNLIAGIVYHNYHPDSGVIELSAGSVSRRWMQGHVVRALFEFPFGMCGAQLVVIRVSERNTVMISIAKRLGFEGVLIPRLRGRYEAEWVFTLPDDKWRQQAIARRPKIA